MTRKLESFDAIFQTVTERAIAFLRSGRVTPGGEALLKVPCDSRGQAINVQMQLRQYWGALMKADKDGALPEYDPRREFVALVPRLAVRTAHKQDRTVEIVDRSQLSTSRALAKAVGALERAIRLEGPGAETPAVVEPPGEPAYHSPATAAQDAVLSGLGEGGEPPARK